MLFSLLHKQLSYLWLLYFSSMVLLNDDPNFFSKENELQQCAENQREVQNGK